MECEEWCAPHLYQFCSPECEQLDELISEYNAAVANGLIIKAKRLNRRIVAIERRTNGLR